MGKMAKVDKALADKVVEIVEIEMVSMQFYILGKTPLIMNRLSEKVWQELTAPAPKKNRAEKETTLKHDPIGEYRSSVYRGRDDHAPTRLQLPSNSFKKAIAAAALRLPGATKTEIGQLTGIEGINVRIFGKPQLFAHPVRQAGMNRAPDIRFRAILPEWCCILTVEFVKSLIGEKQVTNLLGAAGMIMGVGDWRPEKGSGSYGKFACVGENDATFHAIMKRGGLKAQDEGLAHPVAFDEQTEELLAWFDAEMDRRDKQVPSSPRKAAKSKANGKRRTKGELKVPPRRKITNGRATLVA